MGKFTAVPMGKVNRVGFAVGAGTLLVILLLKCSTRLPDVLIDRDPKHSWTYV